MLYRLFTLSRGRWVPLQSLDHFTREDAEAAARRLLAPGVRVAIRGVYT